MLTLHLTLILTLTLTLILTLTLTLSERNAFLWRPVNYNLALTKFRKTGPWPTGSERMQREYADVTFFSRSRTQNGARFTDADAVLSQQSNVILDSRVKSTDDSITLSAGQAQSQRDVRPRSCTQFSMYFVLELIRPAMSLSKFGKIT